jgi:hypothetical protein
MNVSTLSPAVIFSSLMAILLEWIPGLAEKWAGLTPGKRAMLNALGVALISIISVVGGCYWWGETCPEGGVWPLIANILLTFLVSFGGNQLVYARLAKREIYGRGFRPKGRSVDY